MRWALLKRVGEHQLEKTAASIEVKKAAASDWLANDYLDGKISYSEL